MYHHLNGEFDEVRVIKEEQVSRKKLLKGRIRRLGVGPVASQLMFMGLVIPLLRKRSKSQAQKIKRLHKLNDTPIPSDKIYRVPSVNSEACRTLLRDLNYDLIVINGTRIIGSKTLDEITCPIVNTHAGITPAYRGVHGGYWALWNDEPEYCGVTIHRVDKGIDTGSVLAQGNIRPSSQDNFITYPLLQLAVGLPLLTSTLRELELNPKYQGSEPLVDRSKLYYHPTMRQYLSGMLRGVF